MRLERNVGQLTQDMTELKDLAVELVEENVALQVENDNLKRLMDKGEASSEHTMKSRILSTLKHRLLVKTI